MGIGDWGLPNPQSPIPNPQYFTSYLFRLNHINHFKFLFVYMNNLNNLLLDILLTYSIY